MSDELDFDSLTPVEIKVPIAGKTCILVEASGGAATKYKDRIIKATKLGPNGKPISIDGIAESDPFLVSLCLYYADESGQLRRLSDGEPDPRYLVSMQTLQKWPSRVQKALFKKLSEISDLDEPETESVLEKRLGETRMKLADLRNGRAEEDPSKNGLSVISSGSNSPAT